MASPVIKDCLWVGPNVGARKCGAKKSGVALQQIHTPRMNFDAIKWSEISLSSTKPSVLAKKMRFICPKASAFEFGSPEMGIIRLKRPI
jgi:hypothetical protein